MKTHNLTGIRIWLSGAIPDDATPEERQRMLDFAVGLANACFRSGATLLHGCHPSLFRPLLDAARAHYEATQRKAGLTVVASAFFREEGGGFLGESSARIKEVAELLPIPAVTRRDGAADRETSLARMREDLAAQADILIAIGGRWWDTDWPNAGVPAEFNLAIQRGIPTFLLGGLGGATGGYLVKYPETLRNVRNGLDPTANQALATGTDADAMLETVLDQIERLPLGRKEAGAGQRFRILCLDGGGILGVFTASVLANLERMTGRPAAEHFDLIAGTSTGGILALGLGIGLKAEQLVEFYKEEGPEIFPKLSLFDKLSQFFKDKFDASILEEKLQHCFRQAPNGTHLKDSPVRLLIPSYNLTTDNLLLYRTSHHPSVAGYDHLPAAVVARATSAAPTYFKVAAVDDPKNPLEAVDGGIWANCPVMAALSEAVGVLNIPLERIDVLSIGTTHAPSLVGKGEGLVGWAERAPKLMMKAQMQGTLAYANQLLGERLLRVDDHASTNGLEDVDAIPQLVGKGYEVAQVVWRKVEDRFLNGVPADSWR